MSKQLELAEMQLRGFIHGKQGFDVESLVESMALTEKEWDKLKQNNTGYLDHETIHYIDEYFKK